MVDKFLSCGVNDTTLHDLALYDNRHGNTSLDCIGQHSINVGVPVSTCDVSRVGLNTLVRHDSKLVPTLSFIAFHKVVY